MGWFGLVWKGVWRRPGRTALTAASLASAFLLLGLLAPILWLFGERGDLAGVERLVVQPRHSITDFLPVAHEAVIRALPGVRATTHMTWFGGTFRDGTDSFPRWAVPPATYLDLRPEIVLPAEQRRAFVESRTGVIVGRATARKFGLSVGDRIALVPDIWPNKDGGTWEFEIVGVFDGTDRTVDLTALYLNDDFFDEYRTWGHGLVGTILVGLDANARAADVAAAIDARFANSADETATSSERDYALAFADQLGDVGLMLGVIVAAVLFTIALVSANTVAHGIRERTGELAVLSALGFAAGTIQWLVVGEAAVLVLLGAMPGLLGAAALVAIARRSMPQLGGIEMGLDTIAAAVAVAFALTVIAASEPVWRVGRMRIVEALRGLAT
jgi:putative ABC transport system permease protein